MIDVEQKQKLEELTLKVNKARECIEPDKLKVKILALDEKLQSEDIWKDAQAAARISQEVTELKNALAQLSKWERTVDDTKVLM